MGSAWQKEEPNGCLAVIGLASPSRAVGGLSVCGIEHPLAMLCMLGANGARTARKRYNHQSRLWAL